MARIIGHTNVAHVQVLEIAGERALVRLGSRDICAHAHPDLGLGSGAVVIPATAVQLTPSQQREVYGNVGSVVALRRSRYVTHVDVETESGTITAITGHSPFDCGDMVQMSFDYAWALPR